MVTDFRMPKLGFGRRRSAEVLDGALGKWSLDSVKPGFALPQPRASSLLSRGSRFLQVSRAGFRTNSSSATVKHKLITSAAPVLSYTFSIQYQAGSGRKTGTPAQHTYYHLPPASSELQTQAQQRWSTHRELVAPVLSSRTHSRRPAYQLFAGLWSLDSVKPQHQPTAAEGF